MSNLLHLRALRRAQHLARRKLGNRVARSMLPVGRFLLADCPSLKLAPCLEAA